MREYEETKNQLLESTTIEYLQQIEDDGTDPSPNEIEAAIINRQNYRIEMRNYIPVVDANNQPVYDKDGVQRMKRRSDAWRPTEKLEPAQIAIIMARRHNIVRIEPNISARNPDYDYLAIYMTDGDYKGTYVIHESNLRQIARAYNFTLDDRSFKEVTQALLDIVPSKRENKDRDLIAVNNGIFDYRTKQLHDFDPDMVFMSKSHIDYIDNAPNPIITMPDGIKWDVQSWVEDLSDDPEIIHVLWQIIGAVIRPHVSWDKSAWFYSEKGNNGKGTLCELMRNVCGPGTYISLPLSKFSEDAMLEPLVNASAIITDENDVGTYIDQAANLKAVITQDVISINRKYKTAITFRFNGFMVQCVNEFPKMRDKSNSMHRRLLIIPFEKSFEGIERQYIKHDYLGRKDVLEYVLYHVLTKMDDYYRLTKPKASEFILGDYKEYNDPVRQYWNEVREELYWDLLPFNYLYDLYLAWLQKNVPGGKPIQKGRFNIEIVNLLEDDDIWFCSDKDAKVWTGSKMDGPQPLSLEYDLKDWSNHSSKSTDPKKRSEMEPQRKKPNYRGIQRRVPGTNPPNPASTQEDEEE